MITAEPTKKGVGVTIWGDVFDLRSLHETIHQVVDSAPLKEEQKDGLINVAYEVRHAFQGDREKRSAVFSEEVKCTYFGANLIWPQVLFEMALIRQYSSYCENSKEVLSNLLRFEYCIEQALFDYDPKISADVLRNAKRIRMLSEDYLIEFVSDRTFEFLYSGSTGKMRFKRLPSLLASLDETSEAYREYHSYMWAEAKKRGTHPSLLRDMREWADFEW